MLPYLQVDSEVLEVAAPDLAVLLRWDEAKAGWGLLKLFKWALSRCPRDEPPSKNDVVEGPDAARLVARAAGYRKDPEAFVAACEAVRPALLERTPAGVRVRGLDRYDSAWERARLRSEKAKAAAEARWGKPGESSDDAEEVLAQSPEVAQPVLAACSDDAQPMLGECSGDARPDAQAMLGDAKTETETETEIDIEAKETTLSARADRAPPPQELRLELDEPTPSDPDQVVFEHWRKRMGKTGRTAFDKDRRRAVKAMREAGYTVEDLCLAVDGCAATPFNQGQNDRGEKYDDLALVCRDAEHVDRFMRNARAPPKPKSNRAGAVTDADCDWSDGKGFLEGLGGPDVR